MIRILHVVGGLQTGGAELFLERLVQSLDSAEFEHQVAVLSQAGPVGKRMRRLGVQVRELHVQGVLDALPGLLRLRGLLHYEHPGLVQGWLYHGNVAAALALRARCRLLWNVRHSLDRWADEKRLLRSEIRFSGRLARLPECIIFNSERSARQHERFGYARAKATIIPNGFDVKRFVPNAAGRSAVRAQLGLGSDNIVLGMVARYHPLKDHANLFHAMRLVADGEPSVRCVLVGHDMTDSNRPLVSLIRALQLDDRVQLLGERGDIFDLMNALDIYVSSSCSEALPNVVGEAMSCRVPCVVTDAGDSADLVGNTGIVVPVRSPERLAAGILELIRMGSEKRRALGGSARERIRLNYSMERVAQQYANLYRSVYERETSRRSW